MFKNFRTLGQAFDDGKSWISTFRKVPAATATITGQWYDYSYASGNPITNYYAAAPTKSAVLEAEKGIIVPRMAAGEKQYLHRRVRVARVPLAGTVLDVDHRGPPGQLGNVLPRGDECSPTG
jgi:hypothetical protein